MAISTYSDWLQEPSFFGLRGRTGQHKTHHYNQGQQGCEFYLDSDTDNSCSYMTAQGAAVRPGDYIDIASPEGHLKFEVREVEYYSDPADMWLAQLYPLSA